VKKILMLLANGVEPLELSAFTDVMGWAALVGNEKIKLADAGVNHQIQSTFGLTISPSHLLSEIKINEYDALALPGGFEPAGFFEEALSAAFIEVIRAFNQARKPIASVCVSSIALGEAGILQGIKATTYHQNQGVRKLQLENTGAIFIDQPIVIDKNIITSTGPGTAIEVALTLLEQLTSKENAELVRLKMRIPLPSKDWYQGAQVV